jgi:hypothetical protein
MKNKYTRIVAIIIIVGVIAFKVATRRTARDVVEDLLVQIPDSIAFVKENQDLLDIILDTQTRINKFNEEHSIKKIHGYRFIPNYSAQDGLMFDKYLLIRVSHSDGSVNNAGMTLEPGSEFDLFSENEKARINMAKNLVCITVNTDMVDITYATIEKAELHIFHPAIVRLPTYIIFNNTGKIDYQWIYCNVLVDEDWYIEINNTPKN